MLRTCPKYFFLPVSFYVVELHSIHLLSYPGPHLTFEQREVIRVVYIFKHHLAFWRPFLYPFSFGFRYFRIPLFGTMLYVVVYLCFLLT